MMQYKAEQEDDFSVGSASALLWDGCAVLTL